MNFQKAIQNMYLRNPTGTKDKILDEANKIKKLFKDDFTQLIFLRKKEVSFKLYKLLGEKITKEDLIEAQNVFKNHFYGSDNDPLKDIATQVCNHYIKNV